MIRGFNGMNMINAYPTHVAMIAMAELFLSCAVFGNLCESV